MKRYPAYKDCGIDWLGEIPEHWVVKELKYLSVNERYSFVDGPFGSDLKNEEYTDTGVPLIQLNNIGIGEHIIRNLKFISKEKAEQLYKHNVLPNDIVIAKMAEPVARSAKVKPDFKEYVVVADCMKFRPALDTINVDFLVYTMNVGYVKAQAEVRSTGTTRIRIGLTDAKKLKVVVPPLPEQQSIANYLDRKTHLIDTLIENKQKLIDLLKEQRTAIINHAVTKGLNPNVKMQDSGIEWLGEIPEHWAVKKLKYTIRLINEKVENGDKYELLIALENIEGFTGKLLNGSSSFEGSGNTFKKGDVLFNKLRPYLCKVVLTPQEGVAVGELLVFRPNDPINNRFLFYRILSTDFISIVNGSTYGAKMPRASWEFIRNLKIPLSPIIEQQSIVDYLDAQTTRMDKSIEKQGKQIDLLKEYRTAFISEVVTGKIDVRDSGIQEVIHS